MKKLKDAKTIQQIWQEEQCHIACIQDPEGTGVQLNTKTGTPKKGGHVLPVYRSARGSTPLEPFHNHIARFIPGNNQEQNCITLKIFIIEHLM